TVEQVMTRSVITIGADRRTQEAVRLMLEHKIGALPVMDGDRVIGILTETDILRAFVKSAEQRAGPKG
ncbi:MAG: CBS domain-containing protein, partial [Candidatus Rokubacteria bacterium]|nr:CBS domain-containing protein [Candidatus Rokubacteria bacterium]